MLLFGPRRPRAPLHVYAAAVVVIITGFSDNAGTSLLLGLCFVRVEVLSGVARAELG